MSSALRRAVPRQRELAELNDSERAASPVAKQQCGYQRVYRLSERLCVQLDTLYYAIYKLLSGDCLYTRSWAQIRSYHLHKNE